MMGTGVGSGVGLLGGNLLELFVFEIEAPN